MIEVREVCGSRRRRRQCKDEEGGETQEVSIGGNGNGGKTHFGTGKMNFKTSRTRPPSFEPKPSKIRLWEKRQNQQGTRSRGRLTY
jgi:hypothetical protein